MAIEAAAEYHYGLTITGTGSDAWRIPILQLLYGEDPAAIAANNMFRPDDGANLRPAPLGTLRPVTTSAHRAIAVTLGLPLALMSDPGAAFDIFTPAMRCGLPLG